VTSKPHLKPIGLQNKRGKPRALKPSPSLSCDFTNFSYPATPTAPLLDAKAKAGDQKRAAA
jgi:hypothetical protein